MGNCEKVNYQQGPPPPEMIEHFVTSLAEYGAIMEGAMELQD